MNLLDLFVRIGVDDQATSKLDSISASAIAKGQLIANAFTGAMGAIGNAANAVYGFGSAIVGAYSTYEQAVGGIETLFKTASDTVIANSKRAFETAGVSMNQYMEQATNLASALVQSISGGTQTAASSTVESTKSALDSQYSAAQKAYSKQYSALQKALDSQYKAQQKAYQKAYDSYSEQLSNQLAALQKSNSAKLKEVQKANAQEVKDFQSATDERLKIMESEYERKVKLIDSETDARIAAIDKQIKALEDEGDADDDAARESERAAKIAELTKRTESEKTAKKRAEARQELSDYLAKIEKEDRDRARKEQIAALKEQRQDVKDAASEQKSDLKDQHSEEVSVYKESRSQMLEALREANSEQLEALRESQQEQVEQLRKSNQDKLKAMQEAQRDSLEALQSSNQAQLESLQESQQNQLEALQSSIAAQKQALESGATANAEYAEAIAEDYQRAAELADMAIIDMSDNANKMGTSLESIQAAYSGFSKANFTMLDNLKLGYGGTKTEMERLLDDAEKIMAKQGETRDYSVDSMADIVEAIHAVQTEYEVSGLSIDELKQKIQDKSFTEQEISRISQDLYADDADAYEKTVQRIKEGSLEWQDAQILTGTTSREANTTIEGSLRSMGAAWENWLVALANPDTDLGEATDQLIDRVAIAAANIVPRIGVIVGQLGSFLAEKAPGVVQTLKDEFVKNLPEDMQEKFGEFFDNVQGMVDNFIEVLDGIGDAIQTVVDILNWFDENGETIATVVTVLAAAFVGLKTAFAVNDLVSAFTSLLGPAKFAVTSLKGGVFELNSVLSMNPLAVVIGLIAALVTALIVAYNTNDEFRERVDAALEGVKNAVSSAKEHVADALQRVGEFFGNLGDSASKAIDDVVSFFMGLPRRILDATRNFGSLLWNAGSDLISGLIDGINYGFRWLSDTLGSVTNFIVEHKGPPSYDRVMLRDNGRLIMQGLIESIEDGIPELGVTMSAVNSAIEGGVNAQPQASIGYGGGLGNAMMGGVSISIGEMVVREEADIDRIADQLYRKIRREQEAYGWSTSFTMA